MEGVAAYLQVGSSNIDISQIAINAQPLQDGQLKFVIFSDVAPPGSDAGSLLYSQTLNVSATGDLSYILSNPFSFTLESGHYYDIGAIFSGNSIRYTYDGVSDGENGITSIVSNENVDSFSSPVLAGHAASDISIRLYGTASDVPEPATPALYTVALLFSSFVVSLHRRRQAIVVPYNGQARLNAQRS